MPAIEQDTITRPYPWPTNAAHSAPQVALDYRKIPGGDWKVSYRMHANGEGKMRQEAPKLASLHQWAEWRIARETVN